MLENFFDFSNELLQLDNDCMKKCMAQFKKIDEIKEYNQIIKDKTDKYFN